jgi:hypothetical protein
MGEFHATGIFAGSIAAARDAKTACPSSHLTRMTKNPKKFDCISRLA